MIRRNFIASLLATLASPVVKWLPKGKAAVTLAESGPYVPAWRIRYLDITRDSAVVHEEPVPIGFSRVPPGFFKDNDFYMAFDYNVMGEEPHVLQVNCRPLYHVMQFAPVEPCSPATNLAEMDRLVNKIYGKLAKQSLTTEAEA